MLIAGEVIRNTPSPSLHLSLFEIASFFRIDAAAILPSFLMSMIPSDRNRKKRKDGLLRTEMRCTCRRCCSADPLFPSRGTMYVCVHAGCQIISASITFYLLTPDEDLFLYSPDLENSISLIFSFTQIRERDAFTSPIIFSLLLSFFFLSSMITSVKTTAGSERHR